MKDRLGLALSLATLWRAVAALGLTVKNVERAAERDRPDVAAKRAEWAAAQPGLDPARLKFIDETWASTDMARRYGRSPGGSGWSGPCRTGTGRRPRSSPPWGSAG